MTNFFNATAPTRLNLLAAALLTGGLLAAVPAQAAGPASAYTLTRIGLTGAQYTSTDGWQSTFVVAMNAAGQVVGNSSRFQTGYDAWLHAGGTTQRIGLLDAQHVRAGDGYRYSDVVGLNASGQVAGTSVRFNGDSSVGSNAWLYSGDSTQLIGPTGVGYSENGTGRQDSSVAGINAAGQVAGTTTTYNSSNQTGKTAWLYSGGNTVEIGKTGYPFTNTSTGLHRSGANAVNAAGQVVGWSTYYSGNVDKGQATWIYSGGTTQLIGLNGAEYSRPDGSRYSEVIALNNMGQAIGNATRSTEFGGGSRAWYFDGASTQTIGLSGAGYTSSSGHQSILAKAINDAGQAAGTSYRFSGENQLGRDAWIDSGGMAKQIGLTGRDYTRAASGYRDVEVTAINSAGQVAGGSYRFHGDSSDAGRSAWVYDDDLDQTFELLFSTSHTGEAFSNIEYLGDDGLAVGEYAKYFGSTYLGDYAFAWTAQGGMVELGSLVDGGLSMDWMSLALAYRANGAGQIAGLGALANGGTGAFLMTPVPTPVPEPEGYALMLAGLGVLRLAGRRQRKAT